MKNTIPLIVGISGASGAIYAVRFLEELFRVGIPSELVVSATGARILREECGLTVTALAKKTKARLNDDRDMGRRIASGSYPTRGMIVIPASMGTCCRIAAGVSSNLLTRAADVTLKERRKLVVVVRETPLNLVHLRALTTLAEAGAVVLPASPGFYHHPKTAIDLVDFVVARALAQFGVEGSRPVVYSPEEE